MAGTIFICYRRGEDTPSAGGLHDLLIGEEGTFKPSQVFLDVDGIEPGEDFVAVLEAQVAACDVMLCMIGRGWINALERLQQPQDYVHIEIAAALATGKRVIPLLLNEARMPSADQLPEDIRAFTRRQAAWLRHDHFRADLRQLIPILQKALPPLRPERPPELETNEAQAALTAATAPPSPGTAFRHIDATWCPEMVFLPDGTFRMGSPDDEEGRDRDEGPQHRVTIAEPFAIGRYPVTFEEYDHYCKETRSRKPEDKGWGRGRRPVINVSWQDAQAYVAWLSKKTGHPYRLPSEAEWEYACRAGTTTRYSFGDEISESDANFDEKIGKTTEVGAYPANPWGLHDMHGNVWEWCEDCWHGTYEGAPDDGRVWLDQDGGDCSMRVLRGGSLGFTLGVARAAARNRRLPSSRLFHLSLGFRVVCSSPSSGTDP